MTPYDDEVRADQEAAGQALPVADPLEDLTAALFETAHAVMLLEDEVAKVVDAAIGTVGRSAGGRVGTTTTDGRAITGHPWATGDLRLTCNRGTAEIGQPPIPPAGWLVCDGTYVRKDEYPDLYWATNGGHDSAAATDMFQLPAPADLPTTPDTRYFWVIRT